MAEVYESAKPEMNYADGTAIVSPWQTAILYWPAFADSEMGEKLVFLFRNDLS